MLVLRTFSKIYGLAGLRVGYGVGPGRRDPGDREDATRVRRRHAGPGRRAREHRTRSDELAERRRPHARGTRGARARRSASTGSSRPARPSRTSSSSRSATTRCALYEALLRQGAIVRPMGAFGAPGALRITVGTPDENAFFADALASVTGGDDLAVGYPGRLAGAGARVFRMRTTLKRGIGRGAAVTGNGTARAAARRPLADHDLPPAGAARALGLGARSRTVFAWALVALLVVVGSIAGGAYLWFHESVAAVVADDAGREDRRQAPRRRAAGPAGDRARRRLRPARRRGKGVAVPLRHGHARPRRPRDRVDLAALVPARPLRRDRLPRQADLQRPRSTPPIANAARRARSRRCAS